MNPNPGERYFVESNGQLFGPADLGTLRDWVKESRLVPGSILVEESSSRRFTAQEVQGLFPPPAAAPPKASVPPPTAGAPPQAGTGPFGQPGAQPGGFAQPGSY